MRGHAVQSITSRCEPVCEPIMMMNHRHRHELTWMYTDTACSVSAFVVSQTLTFVTDKHINSLIICSAIEPFYLVRSVIAYRSNIICSIEK